MEAKAEKFLTLIYNIFVMLSITGLTIRIENFHYEYKVDKYTFFVMLPIILGILFKKHSNIVQTFFV